MSLPHLRKNTRSTDVINLQLSHTHGEEFKLFFEEKRQGEEKTIQRFKKIALPLPHIHTLSKEINSLLFRSTNDPENRDSQTREKLQQVGHDLYNTLFPLEIKERLASSPFQNLSLKIDDILLGIPWELLFDGAMFFCLRFNMGRMVYTSHTTVRVKAPDLQKIRIVFLADPRKDLPKSYKEGNLLYQSLRKNGELLDVSLLSTHIKKQDISRALFDCNILHYAGHAEYNHENPGMSGWLLEDGLFTAQDILQLSGSRKPFPNLVFSNACGSGKTSEWATEGSETIDPSVAFDLVNAFLRGGVQHYIGTFQDIRDLSSLSFALHFYSFLAQSYTVGESLRNARLKLMGGSDEYCKNNLIWAYYMLYGDPTVCYLPSQKETAKTYKPKKTAEKSTVTNGSKRRTGGHDDTLCISTERDDTQAFIKSKKKRKQRTKPILSGLKIWFGRKIGILSLILILLIGVIFLIHLLIRPPTPYPPEQSATAEYEPLWEKNKWVIIHDIQEKLKARFPEPDTVSSIHPDHKRPAKNTLCIVPAFPQGKNTLIDLGITWQLIDHLIIFFGNTKDVLVVERDRIDFVLDELDRATSQLSQKKLQFSLGRIFGAQEILFVRAFRHLRPLPFKDSIKASLRLVDTQTTAILASTSRVLTIPIEEETKKFGEEIVTQKKKKIMKSEDLL